MKLRRSEGADTRLVLICMEKDELIQQYGVKVGKSASIAVPDLTDSLSLFDNGADETKGLFEALIHSAREVRQDRSGDTCVSTDMTQEQAKVRTLVEEPYGFVHKAMKLLERCQLRLDGFPDDGKQFITPSGEGFRQKMLLVLEEEIDGGRGESSLVSNLAQGSIVDSTHAEHLLGGIQDIDSILLILRQTISASLGSPIGLRKGLTHPADVRALAIGCYRPRHGVSPTGRYSWRRTCRLSIRLGNAPSSITIALVRSSSEPRTTCASSLARGAPTQ